MASQTIKLLILAGVHVTADMFPGALPAILPALRTRYGLSLSAGVFLLTVLNLTVNGMQIATGHLRHDARKPLLIPLGLVLGSAIALCGVMPSGPQALFLLAGLVIVAATGVAIVHPEGLRGVHHLRAIPRSVGSSVFMVGGFFGYYGGAWAGSLLVTAGGLEGLLWLLPVPLLAAGGVLAAGIQLARDDDEPGGDDSGPASLPFWLLMLIAIPANTASVFIPNLLPSCLHSLGKELSFGGFSVFVFGMGGVVGALVWGWLAHRIGEAKCIITAFALASPLTALYLIFINHHYALALLALAGFCGSGPFPLIVALAAKSRGPVLGQRMALIVGGSWGAASLVMLGVGFVADIVGVLPVLHLSWVGYGIAAAVACVLTARRRSELPPPDHQGSSHS